MQYLIFHSIAAVMVRIQGVEYSEGYHAKKGERQVYHRANGSMVFHVPTWVLQLHGYNSCGWFAYDGLNDLWAGGLYGQPWQYFRNLHLSLQFIGWDITPASRVTTNWLQLYPTSHSVTALPAAIKMALAEALTAVPSIKADRIGQIIGR